MISKVSYGSSKMLFKFSVMYSFIHSPFSFLPLHVFATFTLVNKNLRKYQTHAFFRLWVYCTGDIPGDYIEPWYLSQGQILSFEYLGSSTFLGFDGLPLIDWTDESFFGKRISTISLADCGLGFRVVVGWTDGPVIVSGLNEGLFGKIEWPGIVWFSILGVPFVNSGGPAENLVRIRS